MIGGRNNMNKTVLIIWIIFLLIGASVVSSTGKIAEDTHIDYQPLGSIIESQEVLSRSDIAYGYIAYSGSSGYPEGPCYFPLDDPGNITSLAPTQSTYFLCGGTWTCDEEWYGCEYNTGILWIIDPDDGSMENIGGGGCNSADISYNPVDGKWYTLCYSTIYCEGEVVFVLSGDPEYLVGIAFDEGGTLYGWDYYYLWIIDFESGECILVGSHNITLEFGLHGHFDWDTDILYLISGMKLYECDEDTAECILIGSFEGGAEITCLAIPGECYDSPPVTTISFDPLYPDGDNGWYINDVTVRLEANDDIGVDATYYRINNGDWNIYSSPFIISEEGDDILIEYYSVDTGGNVEDVKLAFVDIDKTPPIITVEWEVEKVGWTEWLVFFTIKCNDNASGMDRLEIFINNGLQHVFTGPGWTYHFGFIIYGDSPLSFKFIAYDQAGNYAVVVVNDTDISSYNLVKDIFNQLSTYPLILRLLERIPILERFLIHSNGGRI
jgi:hypothetical protein